MVGKRKLGIRWTVGDVSRRGFEALYLSVWGARRAFGPEVSYVVYVNGLPPAAARARTGIVPDEVEWRPPDRVPGFLQDHLAANMAEGVAWKFAPLRSFPDRYEIALDNDCILWDVPETVRRWLDHGSGACLLAADVRTGFGQFEVFCGPEPRNTGIRGLPPGFDLAGALRAMLDRYPVALNSELDEQGLQVAALSRETEPFVVTTDEVTICSPFWPHVPRLGRSGAHFVGLNVRHIPWTYYDRPATACVAENWTNHRAVLYERIGRHAGARSATA